MPKLFQILKQETALPDRDLTKIISTAPERYKSYPIARRNSDRPRIISQPAREVKLMQRILMREILAECPVHKAASAYKLGASIKKNAEHHAGTGPILKFDFTNFFPSIRDVDWVRYAEGLGLESEDIEISTKLFFKKERYLRGLRLSIGAPSSPMLSNILMYDIDCAITESIVTSKVRYTRYADDITFSAPRAGFLYGVEKNLRRVLREAKSPVLHLNANKTVMATPKFRRQITGLILTNNGEVSVGRERKRNLSAAVHSALLGAKDKEQVREILGLLAFVSSVEPDFVSRLERKYGHGVVARLKARLISS